jgi:hypothetical protein
MDITRRAFVGAAATSVVGSAVFPGAAAGGQPDAVINVIDAELAAMFQRAMTDPGNGELLRGIGSTFRVLDAVATAHDLKRHMRKTRPIVVDGTMTDQMARQLQKHGFKVTGDDLLRRHLDASGKGINVDAVTRQAAAMMVSGDLLLKTGAMFDALGEGRPGGSVAFRESLHGPKIDTHFRQTSSYNACGFFRAYGTRYSLLTGIVAFGFGIIGVPELAVIGTIYGAASLFFDGATWYCEF